MATTSIWAVYKRLDKVIKYTTNEEKTENKEWYKDLHNTIEYVKADFKTEKQLYVSAVNCSEDNTLKDMIATKKRFGKENGVLAYHGFQSFKEGEVTPELAHKIGVKLAQEMWGDKYEVIVSTHLNTNHIHNHFVINSVSFVDGKKYRNTRENYAMVRHISDELCRENGLSVIEEKPCGKHNIDYSKYYSRYVQSSNYYTTTKQDVDYAIGQAYSYNDFENILKNMGYTITIRAGKISLCRPPYKRNIRIERNFGVEYSISNIEYRIYNSKNFKYPFPEAYRNRTKKYYSKRPINKTKIDRGSIYRLYLYYCYLLKVFPKKREKVKITYEMRKDIQEMERMSEETRLLNSKKIKTIKELISYKEQVIDELQECYYNRTSLRNKRKKEENPEQNQKMCDDILALTNKIFELRKEVGYLEDIEKRSLQMKNNIKEMYKLEEQEKKEKEQEKECQDKKGEKQI